MTTRLGPAKADPHNPQAYLACFAVMWYNHPEPSLISSGSFNVMGLSDEALRNLQNVLVELGFSYEAEIASQEDLEKLGIFLLNLTAAAVKTREKMRLVGQELPPSSFGDSDPPPVQGAFPGFD